ncbi:hypothetical protein [Bradyrhizobium nitroreducens]|uniref:hypothetical protein n=1 Tax=Bradyrhizobium nitroreducens TaxID=709803 RepID=UPI0011AE5010|nr:hypothetical protein [Bradyrhizobium nitroreducens]
MTPTAKDTAEDPFTVLRPRLQKALKGFSRDSADWSEQAPTKSVKPEPEQFPVPELILFALRNVLGFRWFGPGEKMRWAVNFGFNGAPVSLEMAKFGFRIYAAESVDMKRLCGQLQVAVKHVEDWLEPIAKQQAAAGNVTVANRHSEFDSRYRFFRDLADRSYRTAERKPRAKPAKAKPDSLSPVLAEFARGWNQTMRARTQGFYHSTAMVDAYFSRLEHNLVLLRAFSGKPLLEGELTAYLSKLWDEKLKALVDVDEPAMQKLYSDLKRIKERVRNPFAHGGVENDGGSLFVHIPTVGALPANFTQIRNSVRFNFIPVEKDDHGAACAVFDEFDEAMRNGPLSSAHDFIEASVDPVYSADQIALYKRLCEGTTQERKEWIMHWSYEQDRHDNMDY